MSPAAPIADLAAVDARDGVDVDRLVELVVAVPGAARIETAVRAELQRHPGERDVAAFGRARCRGNAMRSPAVRLERGAVRRDSSCAPFSTMTATPSSGLNLLVSGRDRQRGRSG